MLDRGFLSQYQTELRTFLLYFLLYVLIATGVENYSFAKSLLGSGAKIHFSFPFRFLFHGFFLAGLMVIGNILGKGWKKEKMDSRQRKKLFLVSLALAFVLIFGIFWVYRQLSPESSQAGLENPYLAAVVGTIILGVILGSEGRISGR